MKNITTKEDNAHSTNLLQALLNHYKSFNVSNAQAGSSLEMRLEIFVLYTCNNIMVVIYELMLQKTSAVLQASLTKGIAAKANGDIAK